MESFESINSPKQRVKEINNSLYKLLRQATMYNEFNQFLTKKYCEENLAFYTRVEEFKKVRLC